MVSPKWYAPNPYKKSVEGMCSGKSSMMVLLLGLQAILCSLYLSYDMMDMKHRDESDSNDIISPELSFKPNRMMVEDTVNKIRMTSFYTTRNQSESTAVQRTLVMTLSSMESTLVSTPLKKVNPYQSILCTCRITLVYLKTLRLNQCYII